MLGSDKGNDAGQRQRKRCWAETEPALHRPRAAALALSLVNSRARSPKSRSATYRRTYRAASRSERFQPERRVGTQRWGTTRRCAALNKPDSRPSTARRGLAVCHGAQAVIRLAPSHDVMCKPCFPMRPRANGHLLQEGAHVHPQASTRAKSFPRPEPRHLPEQTIT